MTVLEALGADAPVTLLATDIDTHVLALARFGVYDAQARGLGAERLERHFLRGTGANAGAIRIKPELVRMIDFQPFNLMSPRWQLGEPFEMVFCRNVMIYFDGPTQRRVLEGIHGAMRAGGLLYVGHSENFTAAREVIRTPTPT